MPIPRPEGAHGLQEKQHKRPHLLYGRNGPSHIASSTCMDPSHHQLFAARPPNLHLCKGLRSAAPGSLTATSPSSINCFTLPRSPLCAALCSSVSVGMAPARSQRNRGAAKPVNLLPSPERAGKDLPSTAVCAPWFLLRGTTCTDDTCSKTFVVPETIAAEMGRLLLQREAAAQASLSLSLALSLSLSSARRGLSLQPRAADLAHVAVEGFGEIHPESCRGGVISS